MFRDVSVVVIQETLQIAEILLFFRRWKANSFKKSLMISSFNCRTMTAKISMICAISVAHLRITSNSYHLASVVNVLKLIILPSCKVLWTAVKFYRLPSLAII